MNIPQLQDVNNLNTFSSNFVTGTNIARQTINDRYQVVSSQMVNSVRENIMPTIVNTIKGINTTATIKSMTYTYPTMTTIIETGDHMFDSFDLQKKLVDSSGSAQDTTVKTKNI